MASAGRVEVLNPKQFWVLIRLTSKEWWNDNTFRLAASLAFYTSFSLAPIVVIVVSIAGFFFGQEEATQQLVTQVETLVGPEGGRAVREVLKSASRSGSGPFAALVGVVTVMVGSTVVFAELQSALNQVWDVQAKRGVIAGLLADRLLSFALVLGVGFLLVVSLAVSAVLAGAQQVLSERMPSVPWLWSYLNLVVSFGLVALLFMAIYKVLPDAKIAWTDVFIGGLVTAVLFSVGKYLIGLYLGRLSVGSAYGAAGSFVVLLVWVYYSALVCFYGAEFTQVYARCYGSRIRPADHAERAGRKPDAV